MSNFTLLQSAYEALANTLEDDVAKYECLILIDQYVDSLEAQATTVSSDVQSYSIGGRSVTRREVVAMQSNSQNLKRQIDSLLYGNVSLVDFRSNEAEYLR